MQDQWCMSVQPAFVNYVDLGANYIGNTILCKGD